MKAKNWHQCTRFNKFDTDYGQFFVSHMLKVVFYRATYGEKLNKTQHGMIESNLSNHVEFDTILAS